VSAEGCSPTILLINPNTSARTLRMMLDAARPHLPPGLLLRGVCARAGVSMIADETELRASATEVLRLGQREAPTVNAIIVAAFGDPGAAALRGKLAIPVVGIGEASVLEAASGERRFGIATTTPALAAAIERMVDALSLSHLFTGVRTSAVDPLVLAADAPRQETVLARLVPECFDLDGAETVIIGGGPLSAAAEALRRRFGPRVIEPLPAAIRRVSRLLGHGGMSSPPG
jgi:allantoin racemase